MLLCGVSVHFFPSVRVKKVDCLLLTDFTNSFWCRKSVLVQSLAFSVFVGIKFLLVIFCLVSSFVLR